MKMSKNKLLPFVGKTNKKTNDVCHGNLLDEGTIGELNYEIYVVGGFGVIHIFDGIHHFKKDCNFFEDELNKLDFNSLIEESEVSIKGSGDNDDLFFTMKTNDIEISLRKKSFKMIDQLRGLITKGKNIKDVKA